MGSGDDPSVAAVVSALVELNREVAVDLLRALTAYLQAESKLIAFDDAVGQDVWERLGRLQRLEHMRDQLERELAV